MASPAAWKYSANKVLKSIIKFYVVIYKQMLCFFYFLFSPVFCEHPEKAEHTKLLLHAACEDGSSIEIKKKGARDQLASVRDTF